MRQVHYRPASVQLVDGNSTPQFAALAARNLEDLAWEARIDRGSNSWDKTYDDLLRKKGFRVASFSALSHAGEVIFASIWHRADYQFPGDT
jgi:hypothetical protein